MENKLQELTQKLYTVGVEKAKNEAEIIIADAQKKADLRYPSFATRGGLFSICNA